MPRMMLSIRSIPGVIANLALWFGLRMLFTDVRQWEFGPAVLDLPVPRSLDPLALGLAVVAAGCLLGFRIGLPKILGITAAIGLITKLALG